MEAFYEANIFFALRGSPDILFGRGAEGASSWERLAAKGIPASRVNELLGMLEIAWFPYGAVFDIEFLLKLVDELGNAQGEREESLRVLAELSRIRLQGTDGLRGKTRSVEVSYREALGIFLRESVVTPSFLGLSAKALGAECLEQGLVEPGSEVVIGSDGRDVSGSFAGAVARGFNELGFRVLDAGVLATPGVPLYARYAKCKLGAIVTASHNPSNQNGIKFIYDGFKLANDGLAGECGLSARMYRIADADEPVDTERWVEDVHTRASEFLYRVDMDNTGLKKRHLEGLRIVYDGANGAYSGTALRVLAGLGADFVAVNVDPRGANINQGGGVGEIEGHPFFEGTPSRDSPACGLSTIRVMLDEGRKARGKLVVGIVNDGDGDRGYLLVYSSRDDRVYVVPGDEIAFWIARGRRDEGSLGEEPVCVNSVESDILAGYYMESMLGVKSETACVGDKNLLKPAREGRNHIVGCEESGHVTFGVRVLDKEGAHGMTYTGNGLLSVLRAISVMQERGAGIEEIVHPFPAGAKDTRYVYFIDKSRFYRGSAVWREDERVALDVMESRKPEGYSIERVDFPDDPQMLYLACVDPSGRKEAALFVRNSGTEIKSCVTIRCSPSLYPMMKKAMEAVHALNRDRMKDASSHDAVVEGLVLETLVGNAMPRGLVKAAVEERLGGALADTDFAAVLFAMKKEGLVEDSGEALCRIPTGSSRRPT